VTGTTNGNAGGNGRPAGANGHDGVSVWPLPVDGRTAARAGGRRYRVVAIPGDGVGPEVLGAARRVLDTVGESFGFGFEWVEITAGGAAIDEYGVAFRPEDLPVCEGSDAVLLGAVGGPKWSDPTAPVRPEQALLALRGGLGLFGNLRPVVPERTVLSKSPIRPELLKGVDLLIIRELTGGLYFGRPSEERRTPEGRAAVDTLSYTEQEIARVVRLGFMLARRRGRRLASVDKANILATGRLWRKIVDEIATEFPDVAVEHHLVDSFAMRLVLTPWMFDVIVTENVFGDILSDEAAVLVGSLGLLPSASLGTRETEHGLFGLYEPIHGSAPDIAGQDKANPIGTILSGAMLLEWSVGEPEAAAAVRAAVHAALEDGYRTQDVMPVAASDASLKLVGTTEFTNAILERVANATVTGIAGTRGQPG
jgi:3-isopropylmalate dehydrogenase